MGTLTPSLKGIYRGLLYFIVLAFVVDVCQARGKDHDNWDGTSGPFTPPTSTLASNGTILSLSASERKGGRVVTSIVTSYILVTLTYSASEPSTSEFLQPVTSSTSRSFNTTRSPGGSITQPRNTKNANSSIVSSLTNPNTTAVNSGASTSVFKGMTTAISIGASIPISNWNSSTARSGVSSALSNKNTTVAGSVASASLSHPIPEPIRSNRSAEARKPSSGTFLGGVPSSFVTSSAQGVQSNSGSSASSTFTLQISLSEGGTAQTSRATTLSGKASSLSLNASARPVSFFSSSSQVASSDLYLISNTAKSTKIANLTQTSTSGTDRNVPNSSMPHSVSSGDGIQKTTTPATTYEGQQPTKAPGDNDDENEDKKSTKASSGSTQGGDASSNHAVSTTKHSASLTSSTQTGSSGTSEPKSTSTQSTSSRDEECATVLVTATINPPPGVNHITQVTWTSTEVTKTTTRNGIAWPTIFPVWSCGGGQRLCAPQCLIPFLFCNGINVPGPLGFPWAKPPSKKPKGKPRKVKPDDPTNPEDPKNDPGPSETPSSTISSDTSCTASTTISVDCGRHCAVSPITVTGSSTRYTTTCHTATCKPTVVCSKTLETTTTTTFTTHSSSPSPQEQFCGDRKSPCLSCVQKPEDRGLVARQHGFIPWSPAPDPELLDGPQGLSRPDTWPKGEQNWWDRMWKYVHHYCDGLTAPRFTLDGENLETGYSTMHADVFGDRPLAGATGPFWGCSGILIITKRGIYTSHVWEIPNFHKGTHKPTAFDWDAEFDESVLQFLKRGSGDRTGGYKGFEQLKRDTPIFDNIVEDTLAIILHVPSQMTFAGISQIPPNYDDYAPRHAALVSRWTDFIADDLGFPRDKIRNNIYVKGPSYWPAYVHEMRPLNPMDMYQPPYGLLHWQYHPTHVVETLPDGKEVRKPTIRVWYEKYLVFEKSWCLPGTVVSRDECGGESCLMPSAPVQSSTAAPGRSGSASASAPAESPRSVTDSTRIDEAPTKATTGISSVLASIPSYLQADSTSFKRKVTVWVTATAEVTVTTWDNITATLAKSVSDIQSDGLVVSRSPLSQVSTAIPSPSYAPSKRVVRITQDIAFGDSKTNHTAVITVYEISGSGEKILVSKRDSRGGGPVDLPSRITVEDQYGGQLKIHFMKETQQVELESKRAGKVQTWTLSSFKSQRTPAKAYCNARKLTWSKGVLNRSVECFYNA